MLISKRGSAGQKLLFSDHVLSNGQQLGSASRDVRHADVWSSILERQNRDSERESRTHFEDVWKLHEELAENSRDLRRSLDRIRDLESVQTTAMSVRIVLSDLESRQKY